jgi:hypothetical protein
MAAGCPCAASRDGIAKAILRMHSYIYLLCVSSSSVVIGMTLSFYLILCQPQLWTSPSFPIAHTISARTLELRKRVFVVVKASVVARYAY